MPKSAAKPASGDEHYRTISARCPARVVLCRARFSPGRSGSHAAKLSVGNSDSECERNADNGTRNNTDADRRAETDNRTEYIFDVTCSGDQVGSCDVYKRCGETGCNARCNRDPTWNGRENRARAAQIAPSRYFGRAGSVAK